MPLTLPDTSAKAEDIADKTAKPKTLSRWEQAAATLLKRSSRSYSDVAESLSVTCQHARTLLHASGGCAMLNEEQLFTQVLSYANMMLRTGHALTGRLIHKVKYDETQMHVRVACPNQPLEAVFAKVFCILEGWTILLTSGGGNNPKHIVFRGAFAPKTRVGQ